MLHSIALDLPRSSVKAALQREPDKAYEKYYNRQKGADLNIMLSDNNELVKAKWGILPFESAANTKIHYGISLDAQNDTSWEYFGKMAKCLIPASAIFVIDESSRYFLLKHSSNQILFLPGICNEIEFNEGRKTRSIAIIRQENIDELGLNIKGIPLLMNQMQAEIWLNEFNTEIILPVKSSLIPNSEISFSPVSNSIENPINNSPDLLKVSNEISEGENYSLF